MYPKYEGSILPMLAHVKLSPLFIEPSVSDQVPHPYKITVKSFVRKFSVKYLKTNTTVQETWNRVNNRHAHHILCDMNP